MLHHSVTHASHKIHCRFLWINSTVLCKCQSQFVMRYAKSTPFPIVLNIRFKKSVDDNFHSACCRHRDEARHVVLFLFLFV